MEVRRSIRLPPKTVASLASKFDNLLTNEPKKKEKELHFSKKGIAQIIGTLEKLDEKAKQETLVLQKNKVKTTQDDAQKKDDIDKLMKSTKSALEEVELPSSSICSPPEDEEVDRKWAVSGPEVDFQEGYEENDENDHQLDLENGKIILEDGDIIAGYSANGLNQTSNGTDKYLQTLQRIAKDNALTGQFKTTLPKDKNHDSTLVTSNTAITVVDQQQQPPLIKTILKVPHQNPVNIKKDVVLISHCTSIPDDKKSDTSDTSSDDTYDAVDYIVKAEPAIVTEDQMDSLSVYDDSTCAVSLGGDLYESIAGSIMNLAKKNTSMEDMYSSMLYQANKKPSSNEVRSLMQ